MVSGAYFLYGGASAPFSNLLSFPLTFLLAPFEIVIACAFLYQ